MQNFDLVGLYKSLSLPQIWTYVVEIWLKWAKINPILIENSLRDWES